MPRALKESSRSSPLCEKCAQPSQRIGTLPPCAPVRQASSRGMRQLVFAWSIESRISQQAEAVCFDECGRADDEGDDWSTHGLSFPGLGFPGLNFRADETHSRAAKFLAPSCGDGVRLYLNTDPRDQRSAPHIRNGSAAGDGAPAKPVAGRWCRVRGSRRASDLCVLSLSEWSALA